MREKLTSSQRRYLWGRRVARIPLVGAWLSRFFWQAPWTYTASHMTWSDEEL